MNKILGFLIQKNFPCSNKKCGIWPTDNSVPTQYELLTNPCQLTLNYQDPPLPPDACQHQQCHPPHALSPWLHFSPLLLCFPHEEPQATSPLISSPGFSSAPTLLQSSSQAPLVSPFLSPQISSHFLSLASPASVPLLFSLDAQASFFFSLSGSCLFRESTGCCCHQRFAPPSQDCHSVRCGVCSLTPSPRAGSRARLALVVNPFVTLGKAVNLTAEYSWI
ncbi:unnamed protein product [Lepidochelys olivacea]